MYPYWNLEELEYWKIGPSETRIDIAGIVAQHPLHLSEALVRAAPCSHADFVLHYLGKPFDVHDPSTQHYRPPNQASASADSLSGLVTTCRQLPSMVMRKGW